MNAFQMANIKTHLYSKSINDRDSILVALVKNNMCMVVRANELDRIKAREAEGYKPVMRMLNGYEI